MPINIKRTGHLVLRVKDLERSKRFFTEILGLQLTGDNGKGMLFFSSDFKTNHHMLAILRAGQGEAPMPEPERQIGMHHVAYELSSFADLREAYRIFKDNGVKIHQCVFHGVTKSIYFHDPDGNILEVYCNVPDEEYESMPNPFSWYWSIEEELQGAPQKPGSVAP
jgi:catechol 2,3-dioxygenase